MYVLQRPGDKCLAEAHVPCGLSIPRRGQIGCCRIDEIHMLVGGGSVRSGGLDISNLMKPALARGQLHCIGATTLDEHRKYFEKDAALERRFQPVMVQEPSGPETLVILEGLKVAVTPACHSILLLARKHTVLCSQQLHKEASCESINISGIVAGYACVHTI